MKEAQPTSDSKYNTLFKFQMMTGKKDSLAISQITVTYLEKLHKKINTSDKRGEPQTLETMNVQ